MNSFEPAQLFKRPFVNMKQALVLGRRLFRFQVAADSTVKELDSYEDRNFYMKGTLEESNNASEFVLKITNHKFSGEGLIAAQSSLMQFLVKRGLCCPQPINSRFGGTEVMCKIPREDLSPTNEETTESENHSPLETSEKGHLIDGIELFNGEEYDSQKFFICAIRLLTFIPGKVLCEVPWTGDVLYHVGRRIGETSLALQKFDHPALDDRKLEWDLLNTPALDNYVDAVANKSHKELVLIVCKRFTEEVLPKLSNLTRHVIHGDFNAHNIIVCDSNFNGHGRYEFGIIDFGDLNKSYRVFDIAIALMYIMSVDMEIPFPRLEAAGYVLAGYHSTYPLTELEVDLLYVSVAARFCQSLVLGAYTSKHLDPGNEYLLYTAKKGWQAFQEFLGTSKEDVLGIWSSIATSRNARVL